MKPPHTPFTAYGGRKDMLTLFNHPFRITDAKGLLENLRRPNFSSSHRCQQKPHPQIVRRTHPQMTIEQRLRLLKLLQPPQTQSQTIETTQKRSVIDHAPRQHALE